MARYHGLQRFCFPCCIQASKICIFFLSELNRSVYFSDTPSIFFPSFSLLSFPRQMSMIGGSTSGQEQCMGNWECRRRVLKADGLRRALTVDLGQMRCIPSSQPPHFTAADGFASGAEFNDGRAGFLHGHAGASRDGCWHEQILLE